MKGVPESKKVIISGEVRSGDEGGPGIKKSNHFW